MNQSNDWYIEYDFKTFHILTKKVTDLIKIHCDESEELISE